MTDPMTSTLMATPLDAHETPPTPAQAAVETASQAPEGAPVGPAELAAHLAARMCHDYISPAGAVKSTTGSRR